MKTTMNICLGLVCALQINAEEPTAEIAGLEQAAADFVVAYNQRDAAGLSKLFTEDGEITNLDATEITSGRAEIQARYEAIFADKPKNIAIEVDSVRLVAPGLAVEDGTYHLTPAGDGFAPPKSTTYTAVLVKGEAGKWQIASTRGLKDVTEAPGHLAALAEALKGEWTHQDPEGIRLDLAFGWDPVGQFLIGEMLTTAPDAEPQAGSIRIHWNAAKKQIVSWMFDAGGGFTQGTWTPTEKGWLIRSEGTTSDGETTSANQQITREEGDALLFHASQRVVDGEALPDKSMRLVRQAPEPNSPSED